MSNKLVSILIISRNRFDSLLEAVDSIVQTAKNLERVEILIRFDDDDDDSLLRLNELPKDKVDMNIIVGKRWGYEFLHEYVNEICKYRLIVNLVLSKLVVGSDISNSQLCMNVLDYI